MSWSIQPSFESEIAEDIPRWTRWGPRLALLAIVLAGAWLRLHDLGAEAFDGDEIYAVRFEKMTPKNLGAMIGRTAFHENHPALELVPYLAWVSVFGKGEAAVRMLPVLMGMVSIGLVYLLGKRLGGTWVGVVAAGLLALNPMAVGYSQEARPYATLVMLAVGANLMFLRCLRGGGRPSPQPSAEGERGLNWSLFWYGVIAELALFTHYFAVPVLAAHGMLALMLMVAGDERTRRAAGALMLTLIVAVLPFVGWLPILKYQATYLGGRHLGEADFGTISYCLNDVFAMGRGRVSQIGGIAVGILSAVGIWGYRKREIESADGESRPPMARWMGLAMLVGGVLASGAMAWAAPRKILPAAKGVLESASVDSVRTAHELGTLHVLVVLLPLMVGVAGAVIWAWPWLMRVLERMPRLSVVVRGPLTAGVAAGTFLVVPVVCVWLIGFVAAGFVTPRNLLVVLPALDVVLAMGVCALMRMRMGWVASAGLVTVLMLGTAQYETFARDGIRVGYHTGPWRELDAKLGMLLKKGTLVLSAKTPPMDPALYYLTDLNYRRIGRGTEASGEGVFIHLKGNVESQRVLGEVIGPVGKKRVLAEMGEFEVIEVNAER